ncbi:hypothetical protein DO70_6467 [Burkholderia pseudomallei]|nr:hypothetical protein DO70_6467 [Burkholderia pseudomallei]
MIDARSPTLPWITGADSPLQPFSRMKPRISSRPSSSSFAQTTNTSAIGEFVIHIFEPDSEYPPGTFLARVTMLPGSEPWFGSVSPKQPIHSPVASFGRYFSFCASEPNSKIGTITSDDCTDIIDR